MSPISDRKEGLDGSWLRFEIGLERIGCYWYHIWPKPIMANRIGFLFDVDSNPEPFT